MGRHFGWWLTPTGRIDPEQYGRAFGAILLFNVVVGGPFLSRPFFGAGLQFGDRTIAQVGFVLMATWTWTGGCLFAKRLHDGGRSRLWAIPPLAFYVWAMGSSVAMNTGLMRGDGELGQVLIGVGAIGAYVIAMIWIGGLPQRVGSVDTR